MVRLNYRPANARPKRQPEAAGEKRLDLFDLLADALRRMWSVREMRSDWIVRCKCGAGWIVAKPNGRGGQIAAMSAIWPILEHSCRHATRGGAL